MGHLIVIVVLVLFGVITLIAASVAAGEYRDREPVRPGQLPPSGAGTVRDRWNKAVTIAVICGLICAMAAIALALGR